MNILSSRIVWSPLLVHSVAQSGVSLPKLEVRTGSSAQREDRNIQDSSQSCSLTNQKGEASFWLRSGDQMCADGEKFPKVDHDCSSTNLRPMMGVHPEIRPQEETP